MTIIGHETHEGRAVLTMDTFMAPRSFAQSGLPRLLAEAGFRISPEGDVTEVQSTGTLTSGSQDIEGERERMKVFFPDFPGRTLLEIAVGPYGDAASRDRSWLTLTRTVSTLFHLARSGGHGRLPLEAAARSGPESVLVAEDGSFFILPPTLYRRCAANAGDQEEIENRLVWVHPDPESASPERSFAFMAAALAYRAITGKTAYNAREVSLEEKKEERPRFEVLSGEMRKGRFERLYFAAPTLKEKLVNALDAALNIKEGHEAAEELAAVFGTKEPLSALVDPVRAETALSADFAKKKEQHGKTLEWARQRETFFRKYRGLLSGAAAAVLILGAVAGITVNDMSRRPNTRGMSVDQVVEKFYQSVATLDQEWPEACLAKGVKTDYGAFLTNIYVTTKVRESYERNGGILSPQLLFAHGKTDDRPVYGVTGLRIESDPGAANAYTVSFYLWLPSSDVPTEPGDDPGVQMSLYRYSDHVTLGMVKDRWQITAFEPAERTVLIRTGDEIMAKLADGSADAEPWAPTSEEIQAASEEELKGFAF